MPSWNIPANLAGERVDGLIAAELRISVAEARRLILSGLVRVDGKRPKKGTHARGGELIEVQAEVIAGERSYDHRPTPHHSALLEVVYEDDALVAVAKPPGVASHPLRSDEHGTIANAIVARWPTCADASLDAREGGLVHRLDRGTSGVLIAAKRREIWTSIREAFDRQEVNKIYWALVEGRVDEPLVIDHPLRTVNGTARIGAAADALPAVTRARPLVTGEGYTLVEATARTGRMHQIRAHLAHAGFPLVGDVRYGAKVLDGIPRDEAILHARAVTLPHPIDAWLLTIAAPVPAARAKIIERLLEQPLPE